MTGWALPTAAVLGGRRIEINSDYRDVLRVLSWLGGERGVEYTPEERWYIALRLFYRNFAAMDEALYGEAAAYLSEFLAGGKPQERGVPTPKLLDWEQDAALIVAAVNRVAGCEIRALPYLHWWSFLAWFTDIGEGAFATVVAIRAKRAGGKKLEKWEQEYYRSHRAEVELRPHLSAAEKAERAKLEALLR